MERDRAGVAALEAAGWRVSVIWECQAKDASALAANLLSLVRQPERSL